MTDAQIEKVLAEGLPIAAVLLVRGGWLSTKDGDVEVQVAFADDEKNVALWKVLLGGSHSVYVEASSIIGISVERYRDLHEERAVANQAVVGTPGQGPGQFDEGEGGATPAA